MYVLEVVSGPLDGKTWSFDNEITIGRDGSVATACITTDRYVSRRHAKLWEDAGRLFVEDLESRNGTRIAGQPIAEQTALEVGTPFVVGRTRLRVTKADSDPA